ncbi:MAG: DUF2309 family protein, partial [Bacteroidia bacterium]|nr:DUF2309 family protein [Bacteroidia bacterium]
MKKDTNRFNEQKTLLDLKHFLPTQSPLKDFIHHNTLHALQNLEFHSALHTGSVVFGYKTYLPLVEYRALYHQGNIHGNVLRKIIVEKFGPNGFEIWENKLIHENIDESVSSRIGQLRSHWANNYHLNLDKAVHPILFRYISNFLDQGIATKTFPVMHKSFLSSMRSLELNSLASIFSTPRAKHLLLHTQCKLKHLLDIVVGDPDCFETYLFDQQFAHPGWSGMVAVLEENPHSLLDQRTVSLHDFIAFELLLEIDTLDSHFGENWKPIALSLNKKPLNLFRKIEHSELFNLYAIWQEAYEWTYYNNVLGALQNSPASPSIKKDIGFDALFCIDDRECSFRRHIEDVAPDCNTFGTPGHFGIDCYFQPEHGKFYTKICPAPLSPKHIIRELHSGKKTGPDTHYSNKSHSLILGWLISQTIGFWSAFKLFLNIFKPTIGPATTYSFRHVHKESMLTIENKNEQVFGLQIGYKVHEMADRVESVLKSIGLTKPLSSIVYVIGHGASSINNTHYAGYDCGACSGRPGSVN